MAALSIFLNTELTDLIPQTVARLGLAALLGGVIGLERELRGKSAGLRTNMLICFGSALFTVLSYELASKYSGDHTRIAAQIIPGIGFIGAGSILHSRGSVSGLTTAATIFVVASVGMAAGGGLYLPAIFATGIILVALKLLGLAEAKLEKKAALVHYEVIGATLDDVVSELNRCLDNLHLQMHQLRMKKVDGHYGIHFVVDASREEQARLNLMLHQSSAFTNVDFLGPTERE